MIQQLPIAWLSIFLPIKKHSFNAAHDVTLIAKIKTMVFFSPFEIISALFGEINDTVPLDEL